MAQMLIDNGAKVKGNVTATKALAVCCERGDLLGASMLVSAGVEPNLDPQPLRRPLHHAIHHSRAEMVKLLLSAGSDPNLLCNNVQKTPLLLALESIHNWHEAREIVDLLIQEGADPNLNHESTHTPIHEAVSRADEQMVERLLKAGANPNTVEKDKLKESITPVIESLLESFRQKFSN